MIKPNEKPIELPVTFVGLGAGEPPPCFAAYQLGSSGRPLRKLGGYDGKTLKIEVQNKSGVCKGVKKITVNGKAIKGNVVPLKAMTATTKIVAEM